MRVRRVALYGRVSTDRQARVKDGGLDTQFAAMDGYVASRQRPDERWEVHDCYREEGKSGKDLDRPEFQRLLRDIAAGRIDVIVTYKIDRVSRSIRDFLDLYEMFKTKGVQFVSVHETFDTTTSIGRAMLKLVLVFAELEREQTAERTQATMEHRARQGLWNGGTRPLGYDLDPVQKGVLISNPAEAATVIDNFFKKYLETGSAYKVVRHLRAIGVRKPVQDSRRGRRRGGGAYTKMEIIRLLTNPVYIGKIRFKDGVYDGKHMGIVPPELFDEAGRLMERNRTRKGNSRGNDAHVYLLQGLLRCGSCGSFLTPKTSLGRGRKPHFYYECSKRNHTSRTGCDAKYIPAEAAEAYVLAELRKWSLSDDEIRQVVREANAAKDDNLGVLSAEEKSIRERMKELQGRIDTVVRAIETGVDSRALTDRLKEMEAEERELEEEQVRIGTEGEFIRQNTLSVELMTAAYRDVPAIIDRLTSAGEWHALRDLIAQYVEVIDWQQDADDPTTGTVEIMLFEEAMAGRASGNEKTLDAAGVNRRCVESIERLPE